MQVTSGSVLYECVCLLILSGFRNVYYDVMRMLAY